LRRWRALPRDCGACAARSGHRLDSSDDNVRAARAASADIDNVMFVCGDLSEIPGKNISSRIHHWGSPGSLDEVIAFSSKAGN